MGAPVDDLTEHLARDVEIPFAVPVSAFPVSRPRRTAPSFAERKEAPPPHIPAHLPAFPDAHTHRATAVQAGEKRDNKAKQKAYVKNRRQAELSLVRQSRAFQGAVGAGDGSLLAAQGASWEEEATRKGEAEAAGPRELTAAELFRAVLEREAADRGDVAGGAAAAPELGDVEMEGDGQGQGAGAEDWGLGGSLDPSRASVQFAMDLETALAKRRRTAAGGLPGAVQVAFQGSADLATEAREVFEHCRETAPTEE